MLNIVFYKDLDTHNSIIIQGSTLMTKLNMLQRTRLHTCKDGNTQSTICINKGNNKIAMESYEYFTKILTYTMQ